MFALEKIKKVIARVESLENPLAVRFEPHIYGAINVRRVGRLLVQIADIHKCNTETAKVIYSTSWGQYQIMGFNLYSLGYSQTVWEFLFFEQDQDQVFYKFVKPFELKHDVGKIIEFLEKGSELKGKYKGLEYIGKIRDLGESYEEVKKFIRFYNGSVFPSQSGLDYALKMIHHYGILKSEGVL